MLITKRDKSGYNKHSKNAKYSSPKIRSIVRTASDMTILKRRGRNLLTFCYGFKNIYFFTCDGKNHKLHVHGQYRMARLDCDAIVTVL